MLYSDRYIESKDNAMIYINDVKPEAFECVIDLANGKEVSINSENIISVRQIADKYQIESLSYYCDEIFEKMINIESICNLLNESVKMDCIFYQQRILTLIKSYFGYYASEIVETKGFMEMNPSSMNLFLQSDCLEINESVLYDMVLKWTEYQTNNRFRMKRFDIDHNNKALQISKQTQKEYINYRNDLLKSISQNIRYISMTPEYLVKKRDDVTIFLTSTEYTDILCYHISKNSNLKINIPQKLFQTKRSFNGNGFYGSVQQYQVRIGKEFDVFTLSSITNIREIKFITRYGFDEFHKLQIKFLEINKNPFTEWKIIKGQIYHKEQIIRCNINTKKLRLQKIGFNGVVLALQISGFI